MQKKTIFQAIFFVYFCLLLVDFYRDQTPQAVTEISPEPVDNFVNNTFKKAASP